MRVAADACRLPAIAQTRRQSPSRTDGPPRGLTSGPAFVFPSFTVARKCATALAACRHPDRRNRHRGPSPDAARPVSILDVAGDPDYGAAADRPGRRFPLVRTRIDSADIASIEPPEAFPEGRLGPGPQGPPDRAETRIRSPGGARRRLAATDGQTVGRFLTPENRPYPESPRFAPMAAHASRPAPGATRMEGSGK